MPLSPDLPSTNPNDDLFGHAPFAAQLANSIAQLTSEAGLVLALDGPWGSGKSTVLAYVRHYLAHQESAKNLVVVEFNPWWFAGRDDLAQAFLRQLQAVLPKRDEKLKTVGSLLGEFADGIGGLLEWAGLPAPLRHLAGNLIGTLKPKPKDVPALKAKIAEGLRKAQVRVLVIVDDIDRLDNSEVRQLFTVIKALADFPYVTYLLAFDHEVAASAIHAETHLPGDLYLEKIIQVPFHIPAVDRVALQDAFFRRLNEALGNADIDKDYWTNVYYGGLDSLIRVPRDIVRLTNTLSVTYSAVAGEVNPIDFVAIEAIRVFVPSLYDTIRAHPDMFAGQSSDREDREAQQPFHAKWIADVREEWRTVAKSLVERLFPKTGFMTFGTESMNEWRRDRRVCHPEVFPVYFRLSLPSGAVGHAETMAWVESLKNPSEFKGRLLAAASQHRPDGISKARELLERLMDHVQKDIPLAQVPVAIEALLDVGDDLVEPTEQRPMFDLPSDTRVARPVYHLLKRVKKDLRREVLERVIRSSPGLVISGTLLRSLDSAASKPSPIDPPLLETEDVRFLQHVWIDRARVLLPSLTGNPEFRWLLESWRQWGDVSEVRSVCESLISSEEGLLAFLNAFLGYTQVASGRTVRRTPRLDPAWLEPFIDTENAAARLRDLLRRGEVRDPMQVAATQFLKERDMRAAGKNPDSLNWPDDERE